MFGSQLLEVAIGVIFVFILTSIICSVIREALDSWFKTRAAFLEAGMRELLHDKQAQGLAKELYNHPLIFGLYNGGYTPGDPTDNPGALTSGGQLPSYIPTRNFALALMDIAARGPVADGASSGAGAPAITVASLRANVANLNNPPVQRVLLTALDAAQGDLNRVQAYLEAWYDSAMDRVAGWYKRSSQWAIFWIALVVTIAVNINTITITSYLSHNDVARAALVARAQATLRHNTGANADYYAAKTELDSLNLPIGWDKGWGAPRQHPRVFTPHFSVWNDALGPLVGWLITAIAVMLGAPFWFDVLNKLMVIRSTVKPHEKSPEEASDDRQLPAPNSKPEPEPSPAISTLVTPADPPPGSLLATNDTSELDGCDVVAVDLTNDEDLPAAEGGVA
jgi:hypothetical protein